MSISLKISFEMQVSGKKVEAKSKTTQINTMKKLKMIEAIKRKLKTDNNEKADLLCKILNEKKVYVTKELKKN